MSNKLVFTCNDGSSIYLKDLIFPRRFFETIKFLLLLLRLKLNSDEDCTDSKWGPDGLNTTGKLVLMSGRAE